MLTFVLKFALSYKRDAMMAGTPRMLAVFFAID